MASFWTNRFWQIPERWRSAVRPSRRTQPFRPTLLVLEDRLAPAFLAVTSLADSYAPGTLRSQVAAASPGDTVGFAVSGTIHLTLGEILITTDSVTISGTTAGGTTIPVTINGSSRDRLFEVTPGLTVTISKLTLTDGYARLPGSSYPGLGGAILNNGFLTLDTDTVEYNRAEDSGGAIETTAAAPGSMPGNSASLTVLSSTFQGNRALTGRGGAIATWNPLGDDSGGGSVSVTVTGSTFEGNEAALDGGGIDFTIYSHLAVPADTSSLTVGSSTFRSNEGAKGGGVFFGNSHAVVNGTWAMSVDHDTFDSNGAFGPSSDPVFNGKGGGIAVELYLPMNGMAPVLITGSQFDGDWGNFGGGISITLHTGGTSTVTVTIDQDSVSSNQAIQGGGIYVYMGGFSALTDVYVTNSTIDDNLVTTLPGGSAPEADGGGFFGLVLGNGAALLDLVNDTVVYNNAVTSTVSSSSAVGGGIYLTTTSPAVTSLNSLTVASNYADSAGGGLFCVSSSGLLVRNCCFDLNTVGPSGTAPDVYGTVTSTGYNILSTSNGSFSNPTDVTGAGDLGFDTGLAANGGPTLTLAPLTGSPVIGTGFFLPMQFDDPITDQRGFPRSPGTTRGSLGP
jgi:predicted outer membrane repeat protein